MIPGALEIKAKLLEFLPSTFFNSEIPSEYKAPSGLTFETDNVIESLCINLEATINVFTLSCTATGIQVNGGGGAPGSWAGGVGNGGGINFAFELQVTDYYKYTDQETKNRILESNIKKTFDDVFNSLIFQNLPFGTGVSSHTAQSPGTLISCNNVPSIIGNVSNVILSSTNLLKDNIISDLRGQGFEILEFIEGEMKAIEDLIKYLIDYWLNNTNVSSIIASGGVTAASAGALSGGIAQGGVFV